MLLRFFPALFDKPENIKFQEQEADEVIELFLRRHFITNLGWIIASAVAFFAPVIFVSILPDISSNILTAVPNEIIIGLLVVYYLLIVAYVIENFLFWYYNIYIVTNIHLVDINFHSLLSREVLEVELDDIENVSSKINGIFASLFNYGDVVIKTAAEKVEITFSAVPRPDFVADRIQDLRQVFIEKEGP